MPPQRILDLVRQIAYQLLVGLRLVGQPFLAVLPCLLLLRQQLHHDFPGQFGLRHDHMHRNRVVVQALEPGVVPQGSELVDACTLQRSLEGKRLTETVGELRLLDRAARHAQRIFQRRIGKQHRAIVTHDRHQGGQQVKSAKAR